LESKREAAPQEEGALKVCSKMKMIFYNFSHNFTLVKFVGVFVSVFLLFFHLPIAVVVLLFAIYLVHAGEEILDLLTRA
jgi:hypothetical protein